ncbi:MAG TPA: GGDEF domain-containing protein [Rhodocyclaceae bacterium]|nr:GGDEF domain-containing protein [Rhodocyclaceae bacterium]
MTPIPVLESVPAGTWAGSLGATTSPTTTPHQRLGTGALLRRILRDEELHAVFQPIVDLHGRKYMGYEALIRGPQDGPLHSPAALFDAASHNDMRRELEHACRAAAIRGFAALRMHGLAPDCKLFINLSAGMLGDPVLMRDDMLQAMASQGVRPDQIVIEITENQKVTDFSVFREVLARYRRLGYSFAIDDLGEGFSNLRMWSEIRPEFVKIDRHFISGIANDALKFRLVKAIVDIAEACNATLIAEGIEEEADFATVRDLGIRCGQGFLICRPQIQPHPSLSEDILHLLDAERIAVFPQNGGGQIATVAPLLKRIVPVAPDLDNDTVFARFEAETDLHALPVVEAGRPVGMINRHTLIERFARRYQRELYGKRPCAMFMDTHPLIVDMHAAISEVGILLGSAKRHQVHDGFILTEQDRYVGVADSQDLMVQITEMQIRSARYANPLTQLPGNVPINEHIERLLENSGSFVACYVDICHFKPYNDSYGYRRGDEVLQLLGNLLTGLCDERVDFVGHIGGDDFVLLMQSTDWRARCDQALAQFAEGVRQFINADDLTRNGLCGEDRRGNPAFHPLPSLSIGCIDIEPHQYATHHEISAAMAEAKRQAKKLGGNCLFIERRKPKRIVTSA